MCKSKLPTLMVNFNWKDMSLKKVTQSGRILLSLIKHRFVRSFLSFQRDNSDEILYFNFQLKLTKHSLSQNKETSNAGIKKLSLKSPVKCTL